MIPRKKQSGFLLLEVVVAVGLLVLGMAVIGTQIQSATDRAIQTDQMARVVFLAESKLTEMNTGLLEFELEQEDEFGRLFPHYGWRVKAVPLPEDPNPTTPPHPLDTPMVAISLEVLLDRDRDVQADEEFNFDEAVVVQTYHTLRTLPRPLDLTTDFGLDAEQAVEINEQLADVGGGSVNVNELNPAMFRDMSMEELLEVLPVLMPALGVGEESILNMVPAEIRPVLQAIFAEQAAANEGSSEDASGGDSAGDDSSDRGSEGGTEPGAENSGTSDVVGDELEGELQPDLTDGTEPGEPSTDDSELDDPEEDGRGGRRGSRGGGRRGGR